MPIAREMLPASETPVRSRPPAAAFVCSLTVVTAVALAAVGGLGYAASAARHAAAAARETAAAPARRTAVFTVSSGGDQYRPGYGYGDPNHNHSGPPGLTAPRPQAVDAVRSADGKAAIVTFPFTIDEQAKLTISVVGPGGKKLLLTPSGSKLGKRFAGPQTKSIKYTELVPRKMGLSLRIPLGQMAPGTTYRIVIVAVDPDGNRSTITVPFRLP
jgi:hypothetical protein